MQLQCPRLGSAGRFTPDEYALPIQDQWLAARKIDDVIAACDGNGGEIATVPVDVVAHVNNRGFKCRKSKRGI
jgi:hypothetical protein